MNAEHGKQEPSEAPAEKHPAPNPSELSEVLDAGDNILVFCHLNPDPDSIASALAMALLLETRFGKTVTISYRGIVGRAQNREMVRQLAPNLRRFSEIEELSYSAAVIVDAQPSFGFHPEDLEQMDVPVCVCIDHHPFVESTKGLPYFDVRPDYGSTSTIMTEYLRLFSVEPSTQVATALYYGIKTDTLGLRRRTSDADREAYAYLAPLVDQEALMSIESPPLSRAYFRDLRNAIDSAEVFGPLVVAQLGALPYPDMVAEIADLLLKVEDTTWSVCWGYFESLMFVSVRTVDPHGDAGVLIREVVGTLGRAGGHNTMAAARLTIEGEMATGYPQMVAEVRQRLLKHMDLKADEAIKLVSQETGPSSD